MLWLSLYTKLKCLSASIIFLLFTILNCFQSALKVTGLWLPGLRKKYDFQNWKHFKRWVATNFHGHKKLLRMVSWKWKIVFHGNWNPRAWSTDLPWDWLYLQHIIWIDVLRTFGGSCGLLFTTVWKIDWLSPWYVYYFNRHDVEISSQVRAAAPKAPSVFYATPTEIPKTQQFGVSLSWYVMTRAVI